MKIKFKVGRDAKTGSFLKVKRAKERKATAIVQTITVRRKRK